MDFEDDPPPQAARTGPKKRFRKNKLKMVFDPDERKNFLLGFRKRKQERKEKYIEKLERDLVKEKKRIKQQTQRATKKLSNSHAVLPEVKSIIDSIPEKEETYDLGNTLVSITSLDDQIYRNLPVSKEEDSSEDSEDGRKRRKELVKRIKEKRSRKFGVGGGDETDDELSAVVKNDPFFNPINDEELSRSDLSEEEQEEEYYNPLEMLRKNTEAGKEDADPSKALSKSKLEREASRMLQESEVYKKMQRIKQKRSKKFRMFRLQPKETETTEGPKGGGGGAKGGKAKKASRSKMIIQSKQASAGRRGKRK